MKRTYYFIILGLLIIASAFTFIMQSNSDHLVALYTFNYQTEDESGNGYHAIVYGTPTYVTDRFGDTSAAIGLNGIADYLVLPVGKHSPIAISLWFKIHEAYSPPTIVDYGSQSIYALADAISGSSPVIFNIKYFTHRNERLISNAKIMTEEWHHLYVDAGYQTRKPRVYIDGYLDSEAELTGAFSPTDGNIYVGRTSNTNEALHFYLWGDVDDIHVFDTVLSDEQILNLYEYDPYTISELDGRETPYLYPNPASNKIFVQNLIEQEYIYFVYDLNGKLIMRSNFRDFIDVEGLKPGLYLIKITDHEQKTLLESRFMKI